MCSKATVIIPTYNAEAFIKPLLKSLLAQEIDGLEILVIDSSSTDDTVSICREFGIRPHVIPKSEFDHGGTRTAAARMAGGEILIFMTQDVLPASNEAIGRLTSPFSSSKVAAAFGRQLPHPEASPLTRHLRHFNYPSRSYSRTLKDAKKYGIKAAFLSNAFTAYRKSALEEIGWFKNGLILSEDSYAGAKLLLAGYELRYVAEAEVYHSHEYSLSEEFRRYFDIGVFYAQEKWMMELLGRPEGEGLRFVRSQLSFLMQERLFFLIPESIIRILGKYAAFKLGLRARRLPLCVKKGLSMNKGWWERGPKPD